MTVIVTVDHVDSFTTAFHVEGLDVPEVVTEFLDVRLRDDYEAGLVFTASHQDNVIAVNHDDRMPKGWYVKVVDAVQDCVGDDHEVLSRLANWPYPERDALFKRRQQQADDDQLESVLKRSGWDDDMIAFLTAASPQVHSDIQARLRKLMPTDACRKPVPFAWRHVRLIGLDSRTRNMLRRNGISRVGDIQLYTADELLYLPHFGDKTLATVKAYMTENEAELCPNEREDIATRLERVYGSVAAAPATSLVAIAHLMNVSHKVVPYPLGWLIAMINLTKARTLVELAAFPLADMPNPRGISPEAVERAPIAITHLLELVGLEAS